MAKHCTSASVLLTRLIGTEEDTAFALDEPELDEKNLHDLYDLMWEEEEEEPQEEKKVEVKRVSLDEMLKASASPSECSICFCEFDDMVAELDCGHRFCQSCVETYLQLTISENPVLVHKRSFSRRDGIALSIRQLDLVGVKCPHYNCLGVIEETKIRSIVDQRTYHKFDQFALDQLLVKMMKNKELRPCPFSCGYFIQDDCLCVNPDCRKKQIFLRKQEQKKREKLVQMADERLDHWAASHPDLVRLCPLCLTQIEKNGGCDHMNCTRCKQPFLWSKALPFRSQGHWLMKAKLELQQRIKNPPVGVLFPEDQPQITV